MVSDMGDREIPNKQACCAMTVQFVQTAEL
jgi:hypothetical protein